MEKSTTNASTIATSSVITTTAPAATTKTAPKGGSHTTTNTSMPYELVLQLNKSNNANAHWLESNKNSTFRDHLNAKTAKPLLEFQRDNQYPKMNFATSISSQQHMQSNQSAQMPTTKSLAIAAMENKSMHSLHTSQPCKHVNVAANNGVCANEPAQGMENVTTQNLNATNATIRTSDSMNKKMHGKAAMAPATASAKSFGSGAVAAATTIAAATMKRELDTGSGMQPAAMVSGLYSHECKFSIFFCYLL